MSSGIEPVLLGPDRDLVGADGQHVELTALGRDIGGDALAQDVLFERHPFHGHVGIFGGEFVGQRLHADHVTVVHGRDRQRCLCNRGGRAQQGDRAQQGAEDVFHGNLPISDVEHMPTPCNYVHTELQACQGSESTVSLHRGKVERSDSARREIGLRAARSKTLKEESLATASGWRLPSPRR